MTTFSGQVLSTNNTQTATVLVRRRVRHPLYGKSVTKTKKYHVHDLFGVKVGDKVEFIPCRPISRTKRWVITKVTSNNQPDIENSTRKEKSNQGINKSKTRTSPS